MTKIAPQNLTLSELLHGRLFRIPLYQRAYSWKEAQRQDLYGDLISAYRKDSDFHFMATVVAVKRESKLIGTNSYRVVDVVDGQQRLTTLTLLLKAIALYLPQSNPEQIALESLIVNKQDNNTLLLLQTNHDYSGYFSDFLRDGKISIPNSFSSQADENIVKGITSVRDFTSKWEKETNSSIINLLALVKNKLQFIYHELDEEKLVYTVFEVLNTRGLDVAWIDRTKAVLMGIAYEEAPNSSEMIKELHQIWQRIYENIGLRQGLSSEALRFAATLWSKSSTSRVLADADSLNVFRSTATGNPNATLKISRFIEAMAKSLDTLLCDEQKAAVTKISHARLLAVAIELRFSGENKEALLKQWEHTSFRIFGLCRKDARTGIGDYVRLAREIYHSTGDDISFRNSLAKMKKMASKEFSAESAAQNLRLTSCYEGWEEQLRYFFYARERWLDAKQGNKYNSAVWSKIWAAEANNSIEHILPQNPSSDSEWMAMLDHAQVNPEDVTHRLGNLVLLPPGLNSKVGNQEFSEKVEHYSKVKFCITDEISESKQWTLKEIEERERKLIEWAAEFWADIEV